MTASDRERVSPSKANPFRPRDANMDVANLPKMVKPVTSWEATTEGTSWASRGGWGERARKEASRNLGDPVTWVEPNVAAAKDKAAKAIQGVGGASSSWEAG